MTHRAHDDRQARAAIRACIDHCRSRRDERGRWRAEDTCAAALATTGSAAIADACAAAARRIGAWLAGVQAT